MQRATITTTDYNGQKATAEGVFGGWSDQVAFERRFGVNATVLQRLGESFNDEGELREDADPSAIRTEWLAFVAWRVLSRTAGAPDFEAWLEGLADLDINIKEDDDDEVPTTATVAQLPSS